MRFWGGVLRFMPSASSKARDSLSQSCLRAHSTHKNRSGVQLLSSRPINTLLSLSQETPLDILAVLKELRGEPVTRLCLGAVGCAASAAGVTRAVDQLLPLACMAGHKPGGGGAPRLSLAKREYAVGSPVQAQRGQCCPALPFFFVA